MLYRKIIKRTLDFIFSIVAIIILSPIMLFIAVVIKLDSRGPILFKQRRIGKDKREFMMYKFRTMRTDAPKDQPTHLLKDPKQYVTRFGSFLRRSSLDELPQLFNIIKGDMCVIGPRPALWNQHDLIAARDEHGANDIYPGLTGWAQINGRDELPIETKASYDGEYVERLSLIFDMKVFFKTINSVFRREGIH